MDPGLFAPFIPIVAILAFAGVKVARIWADARGRVPDPHGAERLAALEDEVGVLRGQLEEMHERLAIPRCSCACDSWKVRLS